MSEADPVETPAAAAPSHLVSYPRFLGRVLWLGTEGGPGFYAWMTLLTAIALVGVHAWASQTSQGMAVTGMTDHVSWGLYIANFTFSVGLAAGAVMMVIPAYLYGDRAMHDVVIVGELLAIAAITMCLLFVVADLGRPDRSWHLVPGLGRFHWPVSMLTWDVLVLNGYLLLNLHICGYLLYQRYLGRAPDPRWYVPFVFVAIGWAISIHTVTAFLYCGLGGRPFWNTALLAPRFLASAFVSGPAFLIVALRVIERASGLQVAVGPRRTLLKILRAAVLVNLLMVASEAFTAFYTGGPHAATARYLFFGLHGHDALVPWTWTAVACGVGTAVLVQLPAVERRPGLLDATCLAAFAGIWIEKGMGLIVAGFVPSTLHELVEYSPSLVEWQVTAGVWAAGLMVFTVAVKVALPALGAARRPPPTPGRSCMNARFVALVVLSSIAAPAAAQEAAPAPASEAPSNEELQRRLAELEARFRALEGERADPLAPVAPAPPEAEASGAGVAEVGSQGLVVELPLSMKLKLNGHIRFRGEHRSPRDYRIPGQFGRPATESMDDGEDFVLQRTWLSFDFQVQEHLRAVVSIMDARAWGDQPVGNDAAETLLREGYIEGQKLLDQPLSIKVGRTVLPSLGDGRVLNNLGWANVPRMWDAVQVTYEPEGWWLYGFASNLREAQVQTPRGDENDDYWMTGVYASNRMVAKHELDAYLFWRHLSDDTQFTAEPRFGNNNFARPGDRKDFTAGARLKGSVADELVGYTAEGVYQWGDQAGDPIRAWGAASTLSSTIKVGDYKLKVLGEYAFASGDQDPNDGVVETFDPLFPFGHLYHGHMDQMLWKNLHAASGQLTFWPLKWLSLHADGHVFWLDKRRDAWYALNGRPTRRDATGNAGSNLGTELDLYFRVKLWEDRFLVWAGYSHFWTGEYLRETGKSEDQDWVFCNVEFNF